MHACVGSYQPNWPGVMYLKQNNVQGWTPLMTAAQEDILPTAKALIAKGAEVNARFKPVQLMNIVPIAQVSAIGCCV